MLTGAGRLTLARLLRLVAGTYQRPTTGALHGNGFKITITYPIVDFPPMKGSCFSDVDHAFSPDPRGFRMGLTKMLHPYAYRYRTK